MSDAIKLQLKGMVNPTLVRDLQRQKERGVVQPTGQISLDSYGTTSLYLPDDSDIEPGTTVLVHIGRGGHAYCTTREQERRDRYEQKAQSYLMAREVRQERKQKKAQAAEFWEEYEIPFEHDVAIKGRLAGLSRGSSGTGRVKNTVQHLHVKEGFTDGRLEREAGGLLCSGIGDWHFEKERFIGPDGSEYVPPVSCQKCLDYMDRWEVESND